MSRIEDHKRKKPLAGVPGGASFVVQSFAYTQPSRRPGSHRKSKLMLAKTMVMVRLFYVTADDLSRRSTQIPDKGRWNSYI